MPNPNHSIEYFEIPAERTDELRGFYSSLFGWQFEEGHTKDYWTIRNAGISGGLAPKQSPEEMPTMFITVESIDDYVSKAKRLNAKMAKEKQEIEEGYYAILEDPQGNTFGIWQAR
jgi:uncharacterized protein